MHPCVHVLTHADFSVVAIVFNQPLQYFDNCSLILVFMEILTSYVLRTILLRNNHVVLHSKS